MQTELPAELAQAKAHYSEIARVGMELLIKLELPADTLNWPDVWPLAVEWAGLLNEARCYTMGPFVPEPLPPQHMSPEAVHMFARRLREWTDKANRSPAVGLVGDRAFYMSLCNLGGTVRDNAPGILGIEEEHGLQFQAGQDLAGIYGIYFQWKEGSGLETLPAYLEREAPALLAPPEKIKAKNQSYDTELKSLVLGAYTQAATGGNVNRGGLAARLKTQGILYGGEMNPDILDHVLGSARRGLDPAKCQEAYEARTKKWNAKQAAAKLQKQMAK